MICCLNPDCSNPLNPNGKKFCQSCSTPLVSLLRNRFRVIRVLSDEGGFGRTYLSEDVDKLNERCVIKQLAPKFQGTWSQKKAMELFAEEAQRLQDLGEHPQIPTLLAYFDQDGCLYLVQQFINGENLLKELQQRKSYNAREIQSILLDLLPILKFIHDRKVIHRDIKPENIIRNKSDGRLSLIDFGSSKQFTAKVQQKSGTSIGSHGYSPLEQIRDGKAFPASDLFGLGATCFHLLTGNSPFQLWMESGYAWVSNWREYLRSPLNAELDFVIDKLLKKDIHERYQSADEVLRDLSPKQLLALPPAGKSYGKIPPTKAPHLPKSYPLLRILILASALILLFGFQESWYRHFRRIQTSLVSRLTQHNNSGKDEAFLGQPLKITLGKVSLANTLQGHKNSVLSVTISPDGKTIVSSGGDSTIKLWNFATGKQISSLNAYSQQVNVVAISPDGKTLVSGSDDNTIKIWDLATGEQIRTLTGHTFWVRSLAISPNGVILASGSFDKTIKIWNLTKGYSIRTLEGNYQTVTAVAISPDGKTLASASRNRTIKLWNLTTGKEIRTLTGHANTVTSVAFSADGKIVASGSRDRTIKLWNSAIGEEILTLTGHSNTVTSVTFSPDGKTLVSGSEDNTIKIWQLSQ